jgi:hypothetical protein
MTDEDNRKGTHPVLYHFDQALELHQGLGAQIMGVIDKKARSAFSAS